MELILHPRVRGLRGQVRQVEGMVLNWAGKFCNTSCDTCTHMVIIIIIIP